MRTAITSITLLFIASFATLFGQESDKPVTAIPRLVRVSGAFQPANGLPVGTTESVTLSIYKEEEGGSPLWQETQNIAVDANGQYTAMLGITQSDGVPLDLFSATEPRWLGIQFNRPGEMEQPRVQLVSVPYALKASDAETLGGRPASAYLLDPNLTSNSTANASNSGTSTSPISLPNSKSLRPFSISGSINYLPYFTDNTNDLGNSLIYQNGTNIGIGTTLPLISLDVRTNALPQMGIAGATDYLTFFASDVYGPAIYWDPNKDMRFGSGGTGLFNPYGFVEQMRMQSSTGNLGIGTKTPGSKLDVAGDINLTGTLRWQNAPVLQACASCGSTSLGIGATAPSSANGNTAIGYFALSANTTGGSNTALGNLSLLHNTIGGSNTALGDGSLLSNTTGSQNVAVGGGLENNTTGSNNIAIGAAAASAVSGGNSNNIHIGTLGASTDSATIRIGGNTSLGDTAAQTQFFVAGVSGTNISGVPVLINTTTGQLGVTSSSRRFKEDIQDMGDASSGLMRLRPVTFRYKKVFEDGSKPIQYGLIAEEVAEVYPDLVAHSADGQIETVKYQVLDSMLLNEVQKQQKEIGSQRDRIAQLENQIFDQRQQNQSLQDRLARLEAAMEKMTNGTGLQ